MTTSLEFGLDTFGDVTRDSAGAALPHAQVIRNVIDEAVLADELGIDFIGLGEHHRADFAISAPEVVLAAIAARTKRIRLGSAVTVLSSDDPIRVFQRFSTVDAASNGRAEVILGRGSFTESFPLFGFDLRQYEELFEEKLGLFVELLKQEPVTWQGKLRAPLQNQRVFPPIEHGTLKTWIGVGGSPESVVRAAHYDLPLMLAIIGGDPKRFAPYVDLYQRAYREFGRTVKPIGVPMSPRPTRRRARSCLPTTRPCATASARSAAGRQWAATNSCARPITVRSMSARRRRWRGRLPRP
jgi:alkanesulfonate monooxygenase SsuD/methylene tetrahydromethanopterin reductase-like flavin-dependent oxidoreductase (luciferase family)